MMKRIVAITLICSTIFSATQAGETQTERNNTGWLNPDFMIPVGAGLVAAGVAGLNFGALQQYYLFPNPDDCVAFNTMVGRVYTAGFVAASPLALFHIKKNYEYYKTKTQEFVQYVGGAERLAWGAAAVTTGTITYLRGIEMVGRQFGITMTCNYPPAN